MNPDPTAHNQFQEAVTLARRGNVAQAYRLLQQVTRRNPRNAQAWMWLAYVSQTVEQKRAALRQAMTLQPENQQIRDALIQIVTPRHIQRAARQGVFIGYARADELIAVDLTDSLCQNDIRAWLDMTEISTDTTWHGSITRALHESGLMLLILSPAALHSEELRAEMTLFMQTGKIILPVIHEHCDFASLGLLCPPVDFRDNYLLGLQQLLTLLTTPLGAGNAV
jgi:hypothetical protein